MPDLPPDAQADHPDAILSTHRTGHLSLSLYDALMPDRRGTVVIGRNSTGLASRVKELADNSGREWVALVDMFPTIVGRESNTFNPFTYGDTAAIKAMLEALIKHDAFGKSRSANAVFCDRAAALCTAVAPALVWLRDVKHIAVDIGLVRSAFTLKWIQDLALSKLVMQSYGDGLTLEHVRCDDAPEEIIGSLRAYLAELPGFDLSSRPGEQPNRIAVEQHGYVQFYVSSTITLLAVTLGHIFSAGLNNVDLHALHSDAGILVIGLPDLETSPDSLASLVKLIIASVSAATVGLPDETATDSSVLLDDWLHDRVGTLPDYPGVVVEGFNLPIEGNQHVA